MKKRSYRKKSSKKAGPSKKLMRQGGTGGARSFKLTELFSFDVAPALTPTNNVALYNISLLNNTVSSPTSFFTPVTPSIV